jgi:small-conductance mechanosensitive channel
MTYEQFWNQDCDLVKYYRKAAQIKQDLKNQNAWLQGLYIYEALVDVAPYLRAMGAKKPTPYRKEPFDLNMRKDEKVQEHKEQQNDSKAKAFMEAFAIANNRKFQEKGGGVNG